MTYCEVQRGTDFLPLLRLFVSPRKGCGTRDKTRYAFRRVIGGDLHADLHQQRAGVSNME